MNTFRLANRLIFVENILFIERVSANNFTIHLAGQSIANITLAQIEPLIALVGFKP